MDRSRMSGGGGQPAEVDLHHDGIEDVSRRQFCYGLAAAGIVGAGLAGWSGTALGLTGDRHSVSGYRAGSGLFFRIRQVDCTGATTDGVVHPGALPIWQRFDGADWHHRTTAGTALIEIEGQLYRVPRGSSLVIPAGRRFAYRNEGTAAWAFEAHHPFWQPAAFRWGQGEGEFGAEDLRFEARRSPGQARSGALYRIAGASEASRASATRTHVRLPRGEVRLARPVEACRFGGLVREAESGRPGASPAPAVILWDLNREQLSRGVPAWFEIVVPA